MRDSFRSNRLFINWNRRCLELVQGRDDSSIFNQYKPTLTLRYTIILPRRTAEAINNTDTNKSEKINNSAAFAAHITRIYSNFYLKTLSAREARWLYFPSTLWTCSKESSTPKSSYWASFCFTCVNIADNDGCTRPYLFTLYGYEDDPEVSTATIHLCLEKERFTLWKHQQQFLFIVLHWAVCFFHSIISVSLKLKSTFSSLYSHPILAARKH